jgi:hypothetical protein
MEQAVQEIQANVQRSEEYLSLVEAVREDGRNTHHTLLRLGEVSELRSSGQIDRIIRALRAYAEQRARGSRLESCPVRWRGPLPRRWIPIWARSVVHAPQFLEMRRARFRVFHELRSCGRVNDQG